jgi:hypothetical protein
VKFEGFAISGSGLFLLWLFVWARMKKQSFFYTDAGFSIIIVLIIPEIHICSRSPAKFSVFDKTVFQGFRLIFGQPSKYGGSVN